MENIIEVKNLTKTYKNKIAVDNLSFNVKKGEILGLRSKWQWKNYNNKFYVVTIKF